MCLKGVWKVFWGMLGWLWIMPNHLMKLQWRNIEYCFNRLVPFLSIILDWPLSALCWGVCRVTGIHLGCVLGCLSESNYCLGGGDNGKLFDKNLIRVMSLAGFFSPTCFGMSDGCLEGVWGVSWCCLSDSGYCVGGMMWKQLINTQ